MSHGRRALPRSCNRLIKQPERQLKATHEHCRTSDHFGSGNNAQHSRRGDADGYPLHSRAPATPDHAYLAYNYGKDSPMERCPREKQPKDRSGDRRQLDTQPSGQSRAGSTPYPSDCEDEHEDQDQLWRAVRAHRDKTRKLYVCRGPPFDNMPSQTPRHDRSGRTVGDEMKDEEVTNHDYAPTVMTKGGRGNGFEDVESLVDQEEGNVAPQADPPQAPALAYKGPRLTTLSVQAIHAHLNAELKRRRLVTKTLINDLRAFWRDQRVDKEHALTPQQKWLLAYAKVEWWRLMEKSAIRNRKLPQYATGARPTDDIVQTLIPMARADAQMVMYKAQKAFIGDVKPPHPDSVYQLQWPKSWVHLRDHGNK